MSHNTINLETLGYAEMLNSRDLLKHVRCTSETTS
jgi:hypothetical protein